MQHFKNKLCAIAIILLGVVSNFISCDATFLVFALLFSIPLFFAKKNWVI